MHTPLVQVAVGLSVDSTRLVSSSSLRLLFSSSFLRIGFMAHLSLRNCSFDGHIIGAGRGLVDWWNY